MISALCFTWATYPLYLKRAPALKCINSDYNETAGKRSFLFFSLAVSNK